MSKRSLTVSASEVSGGDGQLDFRANGSISRMKDGRGLAHPQTSAAGILTPCSRLDLANGGFSDDAFPLGFLTNERRLWDMPHLQNTESLRRPYA